MQNFLIHWKLHWLKYLIGILFIFATIFYLFIYKGEAVSSYTFNRQIGSIFIPSEGDHRAGFKYVGGIASNSLGNMYVLDLSSVIKFDANGNLISKFLVCGFCYNLFVTTDKLNNIYVFGFNFQEYAIFIKKFDSNGNYILDVGTMGNGDGEINEKVTGLAVDSENNLYVAYSDDKVQKFDSNGNFLLKFGSHGTGNGEFSWPYGIAIDQEDNIYVSDYYNHRIQKFASSTAYLDTFDTPGYSPGPLVVDEDGYVYSFDDTTGEILKFASSTDFISSFAGYGSDENQIGNESLQMALGEDGNIYLSDFQNDIYFIKSFDRDGNFISKWSNGSLLSSTQDQYFGYVTAIALDNNNVYVLDYNNGSVKKFDNNNVYLGKMGSLGSGNGQLNYPYGVAVDSQGNIYVSDYSSRIQKLDPNGTFISNVATSGSGAGQVSGPAGLFVDSQDNLYVADASNHRIQRFSSSSEVTLGFGQAGSADGEFSTPQDIYVDASGNIYVADLYNNRIQKFDSNGNFLLKFGSQGTGNGEFNFPSSVAVNTQGEIFVADSYNSRIQVFDSNGSFLNKFGVYGFGPNQINYTSSLRFDSSDNLYIADYINSTVSIWSPSLPLLISSTSTSVTSNSATITWTTSVEGSSQIEFGPSTSYGSSTVETDTGTRVLNHSVTLSNLPSCTTFQYRIKSANDSNVYTTSPNYSFTTEGCTGMAEVIETTEVKASSTAISRVSLQTITLAIPPEIAASSTNEIVFQAAKLEPTVFFEEAKTPEGKVAIGTSVFNLVAIDTVTTDKVSTFQAPIAVSISYSPEDLNGIDPNTLAIYRYDGSAWFPLSNCSTNTDTYTVSCYTSNFSDFALFATPVSTTNTSNTSGGGLILPINAQVGDTKTNTATVAMNPVQQAINSLNTVSIKFSRNLKRGISGTDVSTLQQYLSTIPGIYPEALITGYFGNLTYKAVKRYQCQYDIVCMGTEEGTGWGVVGKRTREVLK